MQHSMAEGPLRAQSKGFGMNQHQIDGSWDKIRGKAKRIWGELTDDDFKKAEGSVEKLYGTIQKRFGETKEQIQQKLKQASNK
jgi:uncharacterized protein YjbJ (UPF0337 family)